MAIRVLQVGGCSSFGGIETFQILLYRNINHNKFSMDFVINNEKAKFVYENEINKNGDNVFYLPSRKQNYLKRIKLLRYILKNNHYDVIHIHYGSLCDDFFLREALKAKIKTIILHSHSSSNFTNSRINLILHYINKLKYMNANIYRIACSKSAGEWLYCKSNNYKIIKNGIFVNDYVFSLQNRLVIRKEYNLEASDFVIGHISRFSPEKNYNFILAVFSMLLKKNKFAKLLLVGDGVLKNDVIEKVQKMGLAEKVIFTGYRADTNKLLSAMDAFIFPSLSEGLPFSVVESQVSGLKTIISNRITKEVCFTNNVFNFGIDLLDITTWSNKLLEISKGYIRKSYLVEAENAGFSISNNIKIIERIYSNND